MYDYNRQKFYRDNIKAINESYDKEVKLYLKAKNEGRKSDGIQHLKIIISLKKLEQIITQLTITEERHRLKEIMKTKNIKQMGKNLETSLQKKEIYQKNYERTINKDILNRDTIIQGIEEKGKIINHINNKFIEKIHEREINGSN